MVNVCPLKNSAYFGDEDGIDLNPGTFIQSQNLMGDGQMSWHHWELSHLQAQCPSILPLLTQIFPPNHIFGESKTWQFMLSHSEHCCDTVSSL